MKSALPNQCPRLVRLLLTAWVATVFVTGAGAPPQAGEHFNAREHYVELDSEVQAIKEEILEINREILLLEQMSLYPPGQQLVVLVSLANGSQVNPDRITLQVDGKIVSHHDYSGSESAALRAGGVHRLYAGRLSDGEHRLELSLSGKLSSNKSFDQQRSVTITKVSGRKTIELHLGPGDKGSEAYMEVREWQQ
jgi:hypothetical protein